MENQGSKKTYFTPSNVVYLSRQFFARSLVTASRPPGPPFELYDPAEHGKGYEVCDLDELREQVNRYER